MAPNIRKAHQDVVTKSVIVIQRVYRGLLGRRRYKTIKLKFNRQRYDSNFDFKQPHIDFKFKQTGAAHTIQRWSRNIVWLRKRRWRVKYAKFIAERKLKLKLFRAIRKCKGYSFRGDQLTDKAQIRLASTIVMQRIVRGFLGRRKHARGKRQEAERIRTMNQVAVTIQGGIRRMLIRSKYPAVGTRSRMLQRKLQNYNKGGYERDSSGGFKTKEEVIDEETYDTARRRPTICFMHLKLGDAQHIASLTQYAVRIEMCWRRHRVRQHMQVLFENKQVLYNVKLQRWARACMRTKKVMWALRVIQPIWKACARRRIERRHAAVLLQNQFRCYMRHRKFTMLLVYRQRMVDRIHNWRHRIICRRKVKRELRRRRQKLEALNAGHSVHKATQQRWYAHFLWLGAKKTKSYEAPHEIQKLFCSYSVNGGMEPGKMGKFARDCGLMGEDLTVQILELQFAKIKSPQEKRIDYGRFIDLLLSIAMIKILKMSAGKLPSVGSATAANDIAVTAVGAPVVSPIKAVGASNTNSTPMKTTMATAAATASSSSASSSSAAVAMSAAAVAAFGGPSPSAPMRPGTIIKEDTESVTPPEEIVRDFKFAGHKGKVALVVALLFKYLIPNMQEYVTVTDYLNLKSAKSLGAAHVKRGVDSLQLFVRNRLFVKRLTNDIACTKKRKIDAYMFSLACRIQRSIRGFLGRRRIVRIAQTVYTKFLDGDTDREYWCNSRTGNSFWTKPALLSRFDCGMATRTPKQDEIFQVQCTVCNSMTAMCFCDDCDQAMCTQCYGWQHRAAPRNKHSHVSIDNCVQCDFQIGTRLCLACRDVYCDSCYSHVHKKGRLRYHVYSRLCSACESCGELAGQWAQVVPATEFKGQYNKLYCTACYKNDNDGVEPAEVAAAYPRILSKSTYMGRTVQLHREKFRLEQQKLAIEAKYTQRKLELLQMKRENACLNIQRVARGRMSRERNKGFIAMRRSFLRQREVDAFVRATVMYKLRKHIGLTQRLLSDTPLERVMQLYPPYLHGILSQCVENKWTEACRMLVEQEEHLAARAESETGALTLRIAKATERSMRKNYEQASQTFLSVQHTYQLLDHKHKQAVITRAITAAQMKTLTATLSSTEKQMNKALARRDKRQEALQNATERVVAIEGPLELQKLVEKRRAEGIALPFTVTLRKNYRTALVTYPGAPVGVSEAVVGAAEGIGDLGALAMEAYATGTGDGSIPLSAEEAAEAAQAAAEAIVAYRTAHPPGSWKLRLALYDRVMIKSIPFVVQPPPFIPKKQVSRPTSGRGANGRVRKRPKSATSDASDASSGGASEEDGDANHDEAGDNSRPNSAAGGRGPGKKKKKKKKKSSSGSADEGADFSESDALLSESEDGGNSRPSSASHSRPNSAGGNGSTVGDGDDAGAGQSAEPVVVLAPEDNPDCEAYYGEKKEEVCTEDHIMLDRPWLFDDCTEVMVYKMVPQVFYEKIPQLMTTALHRLYPTQKGIAVTCITMEKIASGLEYIASLFDEESERHASLLQSARKYRQRRDGWLKLSRAVVHMTYDFSMRRSAYRAIRGVYRTGKTFARMFSRTVKITTGDKKESPYEFWVRSLEKEDVVVILNKGNDKLETLGEFKLDLKAPVEILREYVERNFRDKLNETIGSSFVFSILKDNGKEVNLPVEEEYRTYSKEIVVMKTDKKTMNQTMTVVISTDSLKGRVVIPPFGMTEAEMSTKSSKEAELELDALLPIDM